jgi:hypothetical protein
VVVVIAVVVVVFSLRTSCENRLGLGGAEPYATSDEEEAKGNDGINGRIGD